MIRAAILLLAGFAGCASSAPVDQSGPPGHTMSVPCDVNAPDGNGAMQTWAVQSFSGWSVADIDEHVFVVSACSSKGPTIDGIMYVTGECVSRPTNAIGAYPIDGSLAVLCLMPDQTSVVLYID